MLANARGISVTLVNIKTVTIAVYLQEQKLKWRQFTKRK